MSESHVGQALTRLLTTSAAASIWTPYAQRRSSTEPHRRAVAAAVAHATLGDSLRGGSIKDRVADALDGRRVSAETLDQLADTFLFSAATRELLHRLLVTDGEEAAQVMAALPSEADAGRPYRTVQLHEVHELGPNGWPRRHTTVQTIEAIVDGLRSIEYSYVPGEDVASVEVTVGGVAVSTAAGSRPDLPGLMTTTIELSRVLGIGDAHELTYVTTSAYTRQPEQVFRRGLSSQVEVVAIKVVFDRRRLPARVWETEWSGDDGRNVVVHERRRIGAAEPSVELVRRRSPARWVGYEWDW